MKKADIKSITQQRESLSKLSQTLQKLLKSYPQQTKLENSAENTIKITQLHEEIMENLRNIKDVLESAVERLRGTGIRFLVFGIATGFFDRIVEGLYQLYDDKEQIVRQQNAEKELTAIKGQLRELIKQVVRYSNYYAPTLFQSFSLYYHFLTQKFPQIEQPTPPITPISEKSQQQPKKSKQKQNSLQQFKNILNRVMDLVKDKRKISNNNINQVFRLIQKHESRDQRGEDVYEEVSLNWFKYQLETIRKEKNFLCCKTIFFQDEVFDTYKKKFIELKSFTKTQDNSKIGEEQEELSRAIAALMNTKGGVIILGIGTNEYGKPKVTGFQLEQKNKKDLVKFIRAATNEVLPKHKGFQLSSQQSQHYYNSVYQLNYYLSIQFINVVKRNTFQNCREPLKIYQKFYICKIAVKMGHPRFLYYVLKNEGNKEDKKEAQVQFFVRSEDGNEKENLEKNYQLIYRKLIQYEQNKDKGKIDEKNQRVKLHDGCLYDMTMKLDTFILGNDQKQDD